MRVWKTYFKKLWGENTDKKLNGTRESYEWIYGKAWYDAVKLFKDAGFIKNEDAPTIPQQPQLTICRYYRQTQLDFNMGNMLVDLCECAGKPASVR